MALGEAILVCLAEEPLTGYDLAKSFDTSIGFFWRADHQQIYRELKRLKTNGWVADELVIQTSRPNKRRYSITPEGREHLIAWSRESHPPAPVKDDLMVKLYSLADVDIDSVRRQIVDRLDGHRNRLNLYERIERSVYRDTPDDDAGAVGRLLGLRAGFAYERAWIRWCEDAIERLSALPESDLTSSHTS